ncbi:MAG: arginine decarboxylase [Lentisphaerae bacterium GWF2_44_16]|nr:MAG: arginine decarboxylase [Lentisphaerae bacterium GWF2_44_16]
MIKNNSFERWSIEDSIDVYGIQNWGAGYFDVSEKGEVVVTPMGKNGGTRISLMDIISGLSARGMHMPVLLRFENILDSQITLLHENFRNAIKEFDYKGDYKGVYPIKVNQQQQIIEEITRFGAQYHHGLEAGSKAELIAAISFIKDLDACLICNGYKDEEYVDLGLYARKMGYQCFFVIERPGELPLIIERAAKLKVKPLIGVRVKLSTSAGGHWSESGGDRSVFGLNMTQLVNVVDTLRKNNMLDCLKLLHYHLGSQIPNIRDIRASVVEACRIYSGLVEEGAAMGFFNLGGGLAVDYDGSQTNFTSSRNYTLEEYCRDIIEVIKASLGDIPHPTIITESGRATVAYCSVLLFNILDVSFFETISLPDKMPKNTHEHIVNMMDVVKSLNSKNLQECYHDAVYYRDEIRQLFKHGNISLRERALAETIFWNFVKNIAKEIKKYKYVPDEFEKIDVSLADIYYCNFSVFQSLPDTWAIDHLFPIMPVHRLGEAPSRQAILSDITCDCDGKISRFIDLHDVKNTLPLHEFNPEKEYYLGVFLVGAYQETLGDLHNLLGDTNVIGIRLGDNGDYKFVGEIKGDSVEDVLSYVEYDTDDIISRIRAMAEDAIQHGRILVEERREIMEAFEAGIRGYTYFEK